MFLSDTAKRQPDEGNLTWLRNCGVVSFVNLSYHDLSYSLLFSLSFSISYLCWGFLVYLEIATSRSDFMSSIA